PSRRPAPAAAEPVAATAAATASSQPGDSARPPRRWRAAAARHLTQQRLLWLAVALLSSALMAMVWLQRSGPAAPTQKDIDAAVLRTLTTQVMPSPSARAAAKVGPSVVRVLSYAKGKDGQEE